jgi:hypothetical protein
MAFAAVGDALCCANLHLCGGACAVLIVGFVLLRTVHSLLETYLALSAGHLFRARVYDHYLIHCATVAAVTRNLVIKWLCGTETASMGCQEAHAQRCEVASAADWLPSGH